MVSSIVAARPEQLAESRVSESNHQSVILIGMPGAGKSTIGVLLAKELGLGFLDTDLSIQLREGKTLQTILDESDYLNLRRIGNDEH